MPECPDFGAGLAVAEGIERRELHHLGRLRIGAHHFPDFEYLESVTAAHIGNHLIFVLALAKQERLGGLRKQVDDGPAAKPEGFRRYAQLKRLAAVAPLERRDEQNPLRGVTEAGRANLLKLRQIEKKEFLWKAKIFLQQAIADERPPRIRQHSILFGEAHRPQRF